MLVFNWNHVCSGKRRRRWLVSRAAEGWAPAPASPGRGGAPAVPHPQPLYPGPGVWAQGLLLLRVPAGPFLWGTRLPAPAGRGPPKAGCGARASPRGRGPAGRASLLCSSGRSSGGPSASIRTWLPDATQGCGTCVCSCRSLGCCCDGLPARPWIWLRTMGKCGCIQRGRLATRPLLVPVQT